MGAFLEAEKKYGEQLKLSSPYFSSAARIDGVYRKRERPFCVGVSEENLLNEIREDALEYFSDKKIVWHDGSTRASDGKRLPSNHLCSSQVACVNFLYPFVRRPQALAALLRPIFPGLTEMLPIEPGLAVPIARVQTRP